MMYAIINPDGTIVRYQSHESTMGKGWRCLPVTATDPPYDSETEVRTGPVVTVGETEVTRVWAVTAKSAETLAAELAALKADLVRRNDTRKGDEVAKHITAIPGQENTYAEKRAEATRWVTAGRPAEVDPEDYPWAADRAEVMDYPSPVYALDEWDQIAAAWADLGRRLERERERVNKAIMDATTKAAAEAAFDGADYPQS